MCAFEIGDLFTRTTKQKQKNINMPLALQMSSLLTDQQRDLGTLLSKQLSVSWADEILVPIISGAHEISIRIMDWFVTNYSMAKGTSYRWEDPVTKESRVFCVHAEYSTTLHSKGRLLFDPFRRGPRVMFEGSNGMTHETTLGQLFFWYWASKYNVIDTLSSCVVECQKHMADQQEAARERKRTTGKRKRAPLSKPPKPSIGGVRCVVHKVTCTHKFDDSDFEDDDDDQSSVSQTLDR